MDNHSPPLTALTEEQRKEALNRFKLLRPFLEDGGSNIIDSTDWRGWFDTPARTGDTDDISPLTSKH